MEICRIVGFWQGSVTLCTFLRVWDNERMHFKSRVGRERSTFLTRKDPFQPSLFLISWNTAQLKLKTIWMITFIISHNEHSCPSCDVILSERSVPASDVRLLPIRSLPTRAQAGTPLSPHHPPPLPLSGGLRADWQHLSSSLFLLCIRFWPPPSPHCVS